MQQLLMPHELMCRLQNLLGRAVLHFLSQLQTSLALLALTSACHVKLGLAACRWSGPCSAATQSGTSCLLPASMALHSWHVSVLAGCALCCLLRRIIRCRNSCQQTCLRHYILLPAECADMAASMCGSLHTLRCDVAEALAQCC